MDELLKLLNASALNESDQEALVEKLEVLIEAKAQEKVEVLVNEEKERLVTEFEDKFEGYKDEVFSKFSTFVDAILEEEMIIPDHIVEYARKGELYEDVIEQFKIRIGIDEGVLDEEAKEIISEAKDEILSLRDQLDEAISENMEAKALLSEAKIEFYKNELCEGLTFSQKSKIMPLLEGITSEEDMDRKFKILSEAFLLESEDEDEKEEDEDSDEKDKKKKDEDDEDLDESTKGKGASEVTVINEDTNKDFFSKFLDSQKQALKSFA